MAKQSIIYHVADQEEEETYGLPMFGEFDPDHPAEFVASVLRKWEVPDFNGVYEVRDDKIYGNPCEQPCKDCVEKNACAFRKGYLERLERFRVNFRVAYDAGDEPASKWSAPDHIKIWANISHGVSQKIEIVFKDPNDLKEARAKLTADGRIGTVL